MLQFDTTFYLTTYPDVAAAISRGTIQSAQQHYNDFGRFESRNPNAFFDTAFYLAQNPDVAAARVNPLQHFIQFGAAEGRFANNTADATFDANNNNRADEFNSALYLTNNPDVQRAVTAGAFTSAYQHFIQFGQFEGRAAPLTNGTSVTGPFTNTGTAVDAGQTLTATTNADTLTGGNLNDTFNGVVGDTGGTLTSADVINGGAGTDTLNARIVSATAAPVAPVISNVENIVVSNILSTGTGAISLASSTGYNSLTVKDTTAGGTTSITGIASAAAITLNNADGTTTLNVLGAGTRTGTTDALNLSVTNGTGSAATPAVLNLNTDAGASDTSFEVLNVTTSGTASVLNLLNGGDNISTLKVTGSAGLALTEGGGFINLKTIDASGLTSGGLNVTTSLAQDVTFTGSAGDDRLAVSGALTNVNANDKLAFGAGTDTLAFTTVTDFSASPAAALASINAATGLERIELAAQGVTALKANDFTVNSFVISGGNAANTSNGLQLTGVESNDSFLFSNSRSGTVTLNGASVAQTANIAFDGSDALSTAAGTTGNAGSAVVAFGANITSLTINSTGTAANSIIGGAGGAGANASGAGNTAGNGLAGGAAIDNTTVVQTVSITGSQNLTIAGGAGGAVGTASNGATAATSAGAAGLGFSGAVSVDATSFTGKLSLVGSTGADVIKVGIASTGDASLTGNVIRAAGGADSITLNTGVDKLDYRIAADSVSSAFDTVTGFAAGQDKFVVAASVSAVKALSAAGTGTLATDIATAFNTTNFGGNSNAAIVTITGNSDAGTYLVVDSSANNAFDAGSDLVVKLVGLNGTLTTTDFTTTV